MIRVIVAVTLAAVVQFVWGFVFFGYLSAFDCMVSRAPDESALAATLKSTLPESGTYFVPMCPGCSASQEATEAFNERHAAGPIVQIHYHKEGFSLAMMPVVMGIGFGHTVLTVVLAALLLRMALPSLPTYLTRLVFVFGLGVFAAVAIRLGDLIWMHHHWAFPVGQMVFCVVAWLLAGVVMGAIIRPTQQHALASKPQHPMIAA
jgi:hypothetical protein